MHMADALVSPAVAGTMYAVSAAAAAYSVKEIKLEDLDKKVPVMGVMGAFVFSAQMINFTIPGTGSSGHLCGGMLLSAVLGPCGGFLTMAAILTIQCLLFADGGLLALGCNVWNMAFYGCFIGGFFIWRLMTGRKMTKGRIAAASVIGCIAGLQLGAFSVVTETTLSGITELPFSVFAGMMQPIHLAIGLVEGLITAAVLAFIYEARPEILCGYVPGVDSAGRHVSSGNPGRHVSSESAGVHGSIIDKTGRMSKKGTVGALAVMAAVAGGVLSLFASGLPDGLEWSMEKAAGTAELTADGGVYRMAEKLQSVTALLPDYSFKASDSAAGTSVSGIAGSIFVLAVCFIVCVLIKKVKKEKNGRRI